MRPLRSAFITCCLLVLILVSGRAQSTSPTTPPTDDELAKRVDGVIERQMQGRHIPGLSLAVVRDGKVIKSQGSGLANFENSFPATPPTPYLLSSMSKQF